MRYSFGVWFALDLELDIYPWGYGGLELLMS